MAYYEKTISSFLKLTSVEDGMGRDILYRASIIVTFRLDISAQYHPLSFSLYFVYHVIVDEYHDLGSVREEYRLMHLLSSSPMDDREWVKYEKIEVRRVVVVYDLVHLQVRQE